MAYSRTLYPLLCTTRNTEALLLAFVSSFNALIADPSSLTAGEITSLDYYGDGTIGYDDRDYWLNWVIGRDWSPAIADRLPFADATPTTKSESDPLGLATGLSNVLIIDADNTNGVYVLESSTNTCWTDAARTVPATSGPGGSQLLFSGAAATTYNYEVFRDIRSILSGDSGSANRRRFPDAQVDIVVYVRGGDYTLDRVCTLINQEGNSINNPDLNPIRIIIRNYPGEVVNFYFGSPASSNTVLLTVSRPDLKLDGLTINGYRISGSDRIFASFPIAVSNAADRFEMRNCTLQYFRAIANDHDDADTLSQYVDAEFYNRSLSAGQETAKLLTTMGIQFGVGNDGSKLLNCRFYPAGDDFPRSVTVPGGATEGDFGECIDVAASSNLTISRCDFDGTVSHQMIAVRTSGGTKSTGLVIEYNRIRNPENTCIGLIVDDAIVRYNRIYDFASRSGAQDGGGIQVASGDGVEIYGNVIWLDDDQASGQTYGIDIGVSQSDATTEFVNSLVDENVLYRCGISYGYNQSPPASDLGRVHDNSISRNILYGLSDYSHTVPDYDAPISTNLGPHSATMYATTINANLIYRDDGDAAMIVERLPGSTRTDWPNVAVSPWFTNPANADPVFEDAATGDFTMRNSSPGFSLPDAETPLVDTDLDVEPYDCTLVPQYLPRMDVYSGRVVKNLSAFALLLAATLASSANSQTEYRTARDGCDTRLWHVDGGNIHVERPVIVGFLQDEAFVIKHGRREAQRCERNRSGKRRSVDEVIDQGSRNSLVCGVANLKRQSSGIIRKVATVKSGGARVWRHWLDTHSPANESDWQFRRPIKLNPEKNVIRRCAVDRIQADDLQFADIIADIPAHGRSTSHEQQNSSGEESHRINPLG